MAEKFLPAKDAMQGVVIGQWTLKHEIGRGKNGVVYRGEKRLTEAVVETAAVKLIPQGNLRNGWETEIHKAVLLEGIEQIVPYKTHLEKVQLAAAEYSVVLWRLVDGINLNEYCKKYPLNITIPFIDSLIEQILRAFVALDQMKITHGDLHAGNILVVDPDNRQYERAPRIQISDFGIGCSLNDLEPKDDYLQLADICHRLLEKIDPATLTAPQDGARYRYLVSTFLKKVLFECDPTVGDFVRNPRTLIEQLKGNLETFRDLGPNDDTRLDSPFD